MSSILFYSTRVRKKLKKKSEFSDFFSNSFLEFFFEFFLSPESRIVPKNVKEGPLGVFEHPFFCKIEKMKGDPLETFKKFAKSLTKPKNLPKKISWLSAGLEPTSFCLADIKNYPK